MKFLGLDKSPIIVAEISGNHGGRIENAKRLMHAAIEAGADVVKIQCYTPDEICADREYTVKSGTYVGRNLYELYTLNHTPHDWIPELFSHAKEYHIPLFSSVFSTEGLKILEANKCPAYKISGLECTDFNLIEKVQQTWKPIVVSINQFATNQDIRILQMMQGLIALHCMSEYPTRADRASLYMIDRLKIRFENVGYSDHSESIHTAAFAAAMGAQMIERHITLGDAGDDAKFSLNPAQFKLYVKGIRRAAAARDIVPIDYMNAAFMRGIYTTQDIKKGDQIGEHNTRTARPHSDYKIAASQYEKILRRKASQDIPKGTALSWEHVE